MRTQFVRYYAWLLIVLLGTTACTHQPLEPDNDPPTIQSLEASTTTVIQGGFAFVSVEAFDSDFDSLFYQWAASDGLITGEGETIKWKAPFSIGAEIISVTVSDGKGGSDQSQISLQVTNNDPNNSPPVIQSLQADSDTVVGGETLAIHATAVDPDGDPLNYFWSKTGGKIIGSGPSILWEAPVITTSFDQHEVRLFVDDSRGGNAFSILRLMVKSPFPLPEIQSLTANPLQVGLGGTSIITVVAVSPTGSVLTYEWSASGGEISGQGSTITWTAPSGPICCAPGPYVISVRVTNQEGGESMADIIVTVVL